MSRSLTRKGHQTQYLIDTLRSAIVAGDFKPGSALRQEELAKTFSSSRMPIREALRTLAAEGLILLQPNRGAVVAPIHADELRENVEMREAAEVLAIRLSVPNLSNAQIDHAAEIQRRIADCDTKDFGSLNKAFHMALYAPCARPRLLAHIGSLHDVAERYLRFTLVELDYVSRSNGEHEAILQACYRRDVDAAQLETSRHIVGAGRTLEDHLRKSVGEGNFDAASGTS